MSPTWQPSKVVASRYQLEQHLGSGGAGEVWRALDLKLRAHVAIKLLDPALTNAVTAQRFLKEAQSAARIRSLHVVQILDQGFDGALAYITMELLEGETLADRLDRVERLSPEKVHRVVRDVSRALAKAHDAGIVHRDLKPANIFLVGGEDLDDEVAKVFDFGIAKVKIDDGALTDLTQAGTLLGTPHYMSPEQALGKAVDYRTDLYSLGILAFEALTGRLPFDAEDLAEILSFAAAGELVRPSAVANVPRAFDIWFAKATHFDPAQRFASAKDQAAALKAILR
ncbi:MAG: serine/threonine-protein kinase [Polyangiaceae bacterium]